MKRIDLDDHLQQDIQKHFDLMSVDRNETKIELQKTKLDLEESNSKLQHTEMRLEKNEVKLKKNIKDLAESRRKNEHLEKRFNRLEGREKSLVQKNEGLESKITEITKERESAKVENIRLRLDSEECQKLREKNEKLMDENKKWEVENDHLQMGWKEDRAKLKQLEKSSQPQRKFQRRRSETSIRRVEKRSVIEPAELFSQDIVRRESRSKAAEQKMTVSNASKKLVDEEKVNTPQTEQLRNKRKNQDAFEDKRRMKTPRIVRYFLRV